jgi:predicted RNase H-like HicB family nuclease
MRSYIGLIHKAADGDFGVSFPDFPSVTATGATLDDARAVAEEALARHIASLAEVGKAIRQPSTLSDVMSDPAIETASPSWFPSGPSSRGSFG